MSDEWAGLVFIRVQRQNPLDTENAEAADKGGYGLDPQRAWRMEPRVTSVLRCALCSMLLHVSIRANPRL